MKNVLKKLLVSTASITSAFLAGYAFSEPTNDELLELIKRQQQEIEALKKAQAETDSTLEEADKKIEATADAIDSSKAVSNWSSKTTLGGYGEHHYNNFEGKSDKVDAHRFVLFVGHEYSDTVRFFSEVELEHSLAGEGKPGEVELEQAFIEWQFHSNHALTVGQFLLPIGILNETHEPDTFYGVERNNVESRIIPATWWETGAMISGEIKPGLSYNFAMHSGLATTSDSSIRGGRQKSANAVANDFAYTARVKYTAVPGLELAAAWQYQEDLSQGTYNDASATLFETHAIYNVGSFGVRALWASWDVSGEEFASEGKDSQEGWYVEPSYKITNNLGVFFRYSSWDETAGAPDSVANEVKDVGINFWLTDRVVFKLDYQDASDYNNNDSLNLGVGWSF